MSGDAEYEAWVAKQQSAAPAHDPAYEAWVAKQTAPEPTAGEKMLDRARRFEEGIQSLITGPLQLGANLGTLANEYVVAPIAHAVGAHKFEQAARKYGGVVADAVNNEQDWRERERLRRQQEAGNGTFDAMGMLGQVAGGLATPGAARAAATVIKEPLKNLIGKGAVTGAAYGATAPTAGPTEDYWQNKGMQTATGALTGGLLPVAGRVAGATAKGAGTAVSGIGNAVRDVHDIVAQSPEAIDRLKRGYYKRLVGEENLPSVEKSLRTADELIPGGKITAAEAVSDNPFGTAIQKQQQVTAATSGGTSGEFNHRLYLQDVARKSAELERDAVTAPMREAALEAATNIDKGKLASRVSEISSTPDVTAVTPARNFLEKLSRDINEADSAGKLYAIRKHIDDLLKNRIGSENNVAQAVSGPLLQMKKAIDDAIEEGGGGSGWRAYLKEYATRTRAIEKSTERAKEMYKPRQRTNIPGAGAVSESTDTHLPNLLSRPAMIANALGRYVRRGIEPKLDRSMALDFQNPQKLADVLARARAQPSLIERATARLQGRDFNALPPPPRPPEPVSPYRSRSTAITRVEGENYAPPYMPKNRQISKGIVVDEGQVGEPNIGTRPNTPNVPALIEGRAYGPGGRAKVAEALTQKEVRARTGHPATVRPDTTMAPPLWSYTQGGSKEIQRIRIEQILKEQARLRAARASKRGN